MNSLAEDLRQLLFDAGTVSEDPLADWAGHVGRFPDTPSQLVCLRDMPSEGPLYLMCPVTVQNDACKAVIRSLTYKTGYSKGVEVAEVLELNEVIEMGSIKYWAIRRSSSVTYLDTDANGRHLFEVTFQAQRQHIKET